MRSRVQSGHITAGTSFEFASVAASHTRNLHAIEISCRVLGCSDSGDARKYSTSGCQLNAQQQRSLVTPSAPTSTNKSASDKVQEQRGRSNLLRPRICLTSLVRSTNHRVIRMLFSI